MERRANQTGAAEGRREAALPVHRRCGASVDGRTRSGGGSAAPDRAGAPAFTLVETLMSLLVIFLLMGLLIVGFRAAGAFGRRSAEQQAIVALRMGLETFQRELGFLPPLVRDNRDGTDVGPLDAAGQRVLIYDPSVAADRQFLQGEDPGPGGEDRRYSVYALAYYLVGALDTDDGSGRPLDGVAGPGMRAPRADGSFSPTGRVMGPFFDPGARAVAVVAVDLPAGRVELRSPGGAPYRYYRWLHDDGQKEDASDLADFLNVPELAGDPLEELQLRSAQYAIVGAGPNGVFGDEPLSTILDALGASSGTPEARARLLARQDNVVEVGP